MFPRIFWNSKHNVLYPLSALGIRTQWLIFNLLRATHRVVGQKSPRVDRKLNDGLEVSTTSLKMLPCQEVQRARRFCGQAGWGWGTGQDGADGRWGRGRRLGLDRDGTKGVLWPCSGFGKSEVYFVPHPFGGIMDQFYSKTLGPKCMHLMEMLRCKLRETKPM